MLNIKEKNQEYSALIDTCAPGKYDCAGLYSISIGDKLVYIGKSVNIKNRLCNHLLNINEEEAAKYKSNKYKVLREAINNGFPIIFDKIYESPKTAEEDIIEDIGEREGEYIRKYLPPLNYQIPKENNWHKFNTNKTAKTIVLKQIIMD